jgi:trk system potassium uptake protein
MSNKIEVGVVGLGKFGQAFARAFQEKGHTVVGVDRSESNVRRAQDGLYQAFQADGTDKAALEQIGFKELDQVVVSTGKSMEASILVVLNLQDLGVKKIWVKAVSEEHEKVLKRLGVHFVVFPERFVAQQIAHRMAVPGLLDYLGLGEDVVVREVEVEHWEGKSLRQLDLTNRFNVQVVAFRAKGQDNLSFVPRADVVLTKGDTLVILGKGNDVLELTES